MSAQIDRLDALGIHNAHNYADAVGDGVPYLDYVAYGPSRRTAGWRVRRNGFRTDPDHRPAGGADYIDHGVKVFANHDHGSDRRKALAAAQEWAGARYGITAWKRTPFGTYMAAEHVDTMAKRIKPLTDTQRRILANVRDDGSITGRHGYPSGAAQHGGWDASYYALLRAGLLYADRDGVTITAVGLARLSEQS